MTMITNIPDSAATVPIGRKFAAYLGDRINHWLAAWIARTRNARPRERCCSVSATGNCGISGCAGHRSTTS